MPRRSTLVLSGREVDRLSVEGKDRIFWDRELAGFGVRVYPSGRKVYVVQSRVRGGPKRVTLGSHGELTTTQARLRAGQVIDRIKGGDDPIPPPAQAGATIRRSRPPAISAPTWPRTATPTPPASTGARSRTTSCRRSA